MDRSWRTWFFKGAADQVSASLRTLPQPELNPDTKATQSPELYNICSREAGSWLQVPRI